MMAEKNDRMFEAYRRYLIPLMAVGEAIASQGRSPGTTALTAEKMFQDQEARARQYKIDEEERAQKAIDRELQRRAQKAQISSAEQLMEQRTTQEERAAEKAEREAGKERRATEFRTGLSDIRSGKKYQIPPEMEGPPVPPQLLQEMNKENINKEAENFINKFIQMENPEKYLDNIRKANQPDFFTKFLMTQQGKLQAPEKISSKQTEGLDSLTNSINILDQLQEKFQTKWAIPFGGEIINKVIAKLGDEERSDFETVKNNFFNELLKARSGGAVTPQEYDRLVSEIGNLNQSPKSFLAKVRSAQNLLISRYNNKLKSLGKSNVETFGWKPIPVRKKPTKNKKTTTDTTATTATEASSAEFNALWGD
jgi:hypothetical protein